MSSSGGGGGSNIGGSVGGGNNSDHQQANDEDLMIAYNILEDYFQSIEQDLGAAQAVPAANDGGGGGVNILLHGGLETDFIHNIEQDFGAAQAVPAPNDGGGGGVNIPLHGGLETVGGGNIGGSVGGGNNNQQQQANDGRAGFITRRFLRSETELLLWLVRHSVWLPPPDILKLLIRRDIEITPFTPIRPQPPAIYLVPRDVVLTSGCNDGYDWDEIKTYTIKWGNKEVIKLTDSTNTKAFNNQTMVRRIYGRIGHMDMFLVHYKFKRPHDREKLADF